ncbi:alpha-L-fucosidase [Candidatus Binatus sp.]|uniref:alpha-L-fucosidase n=1 Tax=Candidatus Binatus sp. TaxID=2811406 RepID=UPI003CC67AC6
MANWFDSARFGMFICWGHCSQRGLELSWPLVGWDRLPYNVPVAEYHSTAATFDPVHFDPRDWARRAKRAGMQYAVFTAKHHDGFAMFHTRTTDYSIERTPFRRDIVREYVEAFRAEGLHVGLYFSLIDWHHPDYPAFTEADKPYKWGVWQRPAPEQWERFVAVMFAQVRELLTNYGQIDLLWFDGGWERTAEDWKSSDLERMIRELQPNIVINDRLPGCVGYATPEQSVPARPIPGTWETCLTMNESWGYNPRDRFYKSARFLINTLQEAASKGGNLLLNVSPMADGAIPAEQIERLETISDWMARNGESIAGALPGFESWQFYGPSTRRRAAAVGASERVYLHLTTRPYETVSVREVKVKQVKAVRALGSGNELRFWPRIAAGEMFLNPDPTGTLVIETPESALDPIATVIAIDFKS